MDHLIGQRFNLISKSEIRYVGTLHEINPQESTIALEDVYSFGTEDRKAASFIPPSNQRFEYIVFRGSDVKDIKVAEDQKENKQSDPPSLPNDPAIMNSSRPGPPSHGPPQNRQQSPFPPQGYPQPPFGGYYPQQQFGRGYGPPPPHQFGPGSGFQGPGPYGPPPPGYYGPPGQGFGPPPNQFQPPPIGPPGSRSAAANSSGPGASKSPQENQSSTTSELPTDVQAPAKQSSNNDIPRLPVAASKQPPSAPTPPVESTPSGSEALAPAPSVIAAPPASPFPVVPGRGAPQKSARVVPAVPMQASQKIFTPPSASTAPPISATASIKPPTSATRPLPAVDAAADANRQAREAVAAAMAKLEPRNQSQKQDSTPYDPTVAPVMQKLADMKTSDVPHRGRGRGRGHRGDHRGRGGDQPRSKIEIPKSDFDFESANAKFNKEDLVKEAIATGSPLGEESPANGLDAQLKETENGIQRKDSLPSTQAYNKQSSFFDDISSEAKDRGDNTTGQGAGRGWRGEEIKKNYETFGQGSVDGGFRGRGRGGFRGRGRSGPRGFTQRGGPNGYNSRGRGQPGEATTAEG